MLDLKEHGRRVPRRAGVDRAADVVDGVEFGLDRDMPGRVEAGEPDTLGGLEELGVDLLPAQPGILIQATIWVEELAAAGGPGWQRWYRSSGRWSPRRGCASGPRRAGALS